MLQYIVGKVRQKWTKSHKKTTLTHSSTQTPPPEKIPNMFGNWGWLLSQTTKFISCKFILAVEMSLKAKPDSYFISFSFCDTIILAAISSVPRGDSPWPLQFQQIVQPSHTPPLRKKATEICMHKVITFSHSKVSFLKNVEGPISQFLALLNECYPSP